MSANTTQPKLEDQIRNACRVRHYSLATERSYVGWYKQFVLWAENFHIDLAGIWSKDGEPFFRPAVCAWEAWKAAWALKTPNACANSRNLGPEPERA